MTSPLNTLLFGGCMIHWPLTRTSCADGKLALDAYGPVREVHTFGEMFQIIEVLKGGNTVLPEYRDLAHMRQRLGPAQGADNFGDLDVALIEPASPVELEFRGVAVNRFTVNRLVRAETGESPFAKKLSAKWMRQGLIGLDDDMRASTAAKLVMHVTGDSEDAELARAVILETRAFPSDISGGLRKMQALLGCPVGVALYVFRYMPDGRAISWPTGFREIVLNAAQDLSLPIFDPVPLVLDYGVEAAMTPPLAHYSEEFLPVAGNSLVSFIQSVRAGCKSRAA
jgi:hypothetical protein